MRSNDSIQVIIKHLNDLVNRHYFSVASYLRDSDPWVPAEHHQKMDAMVAEIAAEESQLSDQLGNEIQRLGGVVLLDNYTPDIIDLSYLSLVYSLDKAVAHKDRLLEAIERLLEVSGLTAETRAIAEEARRRNMAHRERFAEAKRVLSGTGKSKGAEEAN